jgi:hypothetical protein
MDNIVVDGLAYIIIRYSIDPLILSVAYVLACRLTDLLIKPANTIEQRRAHNGIEVRKMINA